MKNHDSIEYRAALQNKRVEKMHTIEIKTTPNKIFPLVCPVEELRWISHFAALRSPCFDRAEKLLAD